jgi:hypothetical protein
MATTPRLQLPYPEPQHVPDVPKWNGDLANRVDALIRRNGQQASLRRTKDDAATGWGQFSGTQANMPAGVVIAYGMARWGGKDCDLQLMVNSIEVARGTRQNYQVGIYIDTLVAIVSHPGGVCTLGLNGSAIMGETLQFLTGSQCAIAYLGPGQTS